MKIGYACSNLELSTIFIDDYLADCLPVYPLIYIWSLRRLMDGECATLQEISERFRITEGDVIKAWQHWEKEGLVSISSGKNGMEITFGPVRPRQTSVVLLSDNTAKAAESPPQNVATRPNYTTQELACYRSESSDIKRLFSLAEKTLGKLLSYNDMNVIFGFHDWLRLPIDVIEFLLEYCEETDHRSLRYIEKCALDWAERGIADKSSAAEYVQNFDLNYRTILRHTGQSAAYPTPAQRKYMNKWLHELNMPLELITEAIDRCVEKINKFDKKYTEKILTEWHKNGILTKEAVAAADNDFVGKKTSPRPAAKNRFVNFKQRDIDYSRYEKLERAYIDQKLNAN